MSDFSWADPRGPASLPRILAGRADPCRWPLGTRHHAHDRCVRASRARAGRQRHGLRFRPLRRARNCLAGRRHCTRGQLAGCPSRGHNRGEHLLADLRLGVPCKLPNDPDFVESPVSSTAAIRVYRPSNAPTPSPALLCIHGGEALAQQLATRPAAMPAGPAPVTATRRWARAA